MKHSVRLLRNAICLAACLTIVYAQKGYAQSAAEAAFDKGLVFLNAAAPDKAIKEFTKVIQLSPDNAAAYYNRALAYTMKGNLARAIKDYQEARQRNPKNALIYWGEGVVRAKESQWAEAISNYNSALRLIPNYAQLYYNRGLALAKQGKLPDALLEFSKALELAPDYGNAYYNRAVTYARMGELERANIDFAKAKEFTRQSLQLQAQKPQRAVLTPKIAVSKKYNTAAGPTNPQELEQTKTNSYFNRGIIYSRTQPTASQTNASLDTKDVLDSQSPQAPQKTIAHGELSEKINSHSSEAEAYCNKGVISGQNGNLEEAISYLNIAIKLNPHMGLAYYNRGVAFFMKKDYDKAWIDVRRAESLGYQVDAKFLADLELASHREE